MRDYEAESMWGDWLPEFMAMTKEKQMWYVRVKPHDDKDYFEENADAFEL